MDQLLLAQTFDPTQAINNFQTLAVLLASFLLVCLTVFMLATHARKGNTSGIFRVLMAVIVALIPMVIGLGIGAQQFGEGFWGWTRLLGF